LISTVVGAAVGGLGANAIEKRIERGRDRSKENEGEREGGRYRDEVGGGGNGSGRRRSGEWRRY
jgi:hypothetical protein